mgnify:CR=1 FL=1
MENRPSHNKFFEKEEQTTQGNLRCNLAIPVLKLSAVVTRGNSDGSNKPIAAEYTWATVEAAEWSKKQLHHEDIKTKGSSLPVKYASDPESYSVPRYYEYIPVQVKNAENDYKQKFMDKHKRNNDKLTLDMVECRFIMFKCNLGLTHQDNINGHYRTVHQFDSGIFHLRKLEIIDVNLNLPFTIPELTDFQSLGPNKQAALLDKVYTHCVARGVFDDTSNRNEANLLRSRSIEFLTEMKRASAPNYYDRFKFALTHIIDRDVEDGFMCVWREVEEAMYSAVGKENKVNRLYTFLDKKPSDFHSKPLELLIGDVDSHVWMHS